MKQSLLFLNTLRETPAQTQVFSHQLMLRAGLVREGASGVYAFLPLGFRVLRKIEALVRRELDAAGAQEVLLCKESVEEEVIPLLIGDEAQLCRKLPVLVYQLQDQFRDPVPLHKVPAVRELRLQDAYSLALDQRDLDDQHQAMYAAYQRIFDRISLHYRVVEPDPATKAGQAGKQDLMIMSESGEEVLAECAQCGHTEHRVPTWSPSTPSPTGTAMEPRGMSAPSKPELCPECASELTLAHGTVVGYVTKSGSRAAEAVHATCLNDDDDPVAVLLGRYGLGIPRLLAAIVAQYHDQAGIIWPLVVAPYQVHLIPTSMRDEEQVRIAQVLYQRLQAAQVEVLFDDRDERIGVKSVDADLLGIPVRIIVGSRVRDGEVEVLLRNTGESEVYAIESAFKRVLNIVK